ncbi:MAG: metallophosphoesterase [Deltaproteobacteria bacterium]|nr:metallophosphoesterase [Deltaproteobacteria bacterium]
MGLTRILLLADTHLGFDLPSRPRVERRRRGHDFFASFRRALAPALAGEADVVVHGGDLFFSSRVSAGLADDAFSELRRVADAGVPVLIVPGNHERSRIPRPLLAVHRRIHVFAEPRTVVIDSGGLCVAFAGFPYCRDGVRRQFPALLERTGYRSVRADVRLICMHHCFEGATCGNGSGRDHTFRFEDDAVRAADLPGDVAAVLTGHIHRHQVLTRDLSGRRLSAPVLYPGSTERTSFAERDEVKGVLLVELSSSGVERWRFQHLAARPMIAVDLSGPFAGPEALDRFVEDAIGASPPDAILRFRVTAPLPPRAAEILSAARLRSIAPATMNIDVRVAVGALAPAAPGGYDPRG